MIFYEAEANTAKSKHHNSLTNELYLWYFNKLKIKLNTLQIVHAYLYYNHLLTIGIKKVWKH